MPLDVFNVEYILRAERLKRRNGDVIWVYTVKWKNFGYFNYSREDEGHQCFQRDNSLLKDFWASTGYHPDDFDGMVAAIEPPTSYIDECKRARLKNKLSDGDHGIENDSSHFTPTDASDGCASLFGDTDYINKHATPTSKPAQRTQNRNSPVESAGLAVSYYEAFSPPRREGILGPRTISVATFDKKTGSLVTTKRKQNSLDYQNSLSKRHRPSFSVATPHTTSAQLPQPTGQGILTLSGYSQTDAEALPDFDDMLVDSDDIRHSACPQTEQFGPPELGIDDDNLYVPRDSSVDVSGPRGNREDQGGLQSSSMTTISSAENYVDSLPTTSGGTTAHEVTQQPNTSERALGAPGSTQMQIDSAKSDLPGFNLILDVAHVLPLVFKDIPFGMFNASNDLMFSKLSLTIYGFYAHSDVQSVIASWREGNVCDTAKLCLQEGGITNQHKERWHTLHQELFRNQLCLITFLPDTPDAFIIFSSQSRSFGKAIGANSRRLGWANTFLACCVKIMSRSIPFEKQRV